jgi:putative FmdB family regulatory protein
MPIFEYVCRDCHQEFEAIVTAGRPAACPACASDDLEKQLSVFAVSTKGESAAPSMGACGSCGDPRGPGSCRMN